MYSAMENGKESSWLPLNAEFATLAIHAGYSPNGTNNSAVTPPITLSSTYQIDTPAKNRGFEYSRTLNPNRQILEERLAALEGAKYGMCFSSGLAAVSAMISLLKTGDHIICSDDIYGGTNRLIKEIVERDNMQLDVVDLTDLSKLKSVLKSNTKMVFFETPSNPTLRVFDITQISNIAHLHSRDILVVVDNTLLTSYLQRPLTLGADLVHYSLTKYVNGHADVIMGALLTNSDAMKDKLNYYQNAFGAIPSPFDCYLVTRGIKTLPVRMQGLMKHTLEVAQYLAQHPKIESVNHPGLASHPQHKLAMKQSSGHSSLISFTIKKPGSAKAFIERLGLICNGASFGGCESMVEIPVYFTHMMVPEEQRKKLGITDNFVRLGVGLESPKDLIEDLRQALEKC